MNGSRSTYMRKGYLLTALAAAVLLAASSGTAWAQVIGDSTHGEGGVLITMPTKVTEGDPVTINVSVRGRLVEGSKANENKVEVTVKPAKDQVFNSAGTATPAEIATNSDIRPSSGDMLTFEFGAGAADDDDGTKDELSGYMIQRDSIELDTIFDKDAEDEYLTLMVTVKNVHDRVTGGQEVTVASKKVTITDVDDQIYELSVERGGDHVEGGTINLIIEADPGHEDASGKFRLRVSDQDGDVLKAYTLASPYTDTDIIVGAPNKMTEATDATNARMVMINVPANDKNRAADTVTIEALMGSAGDYTVVDSVEVTVEDNHVLPGADAITAVARDKARNGKEVTEIMEGGDSVYLSVTLDRGSSRSGITDEALTVDIEPADPAQVGDYELSVSEVEFEEKTTGRQSSDASVDIKLTALSDEDVGMEDLMLNLVVSGVSSRGSATSTGTFTIAIVDDTTKKVEPKSEEDAYPVIMTAIEEAAGEDGLNPGESFTVMVEDLFTVMDGYTASYRAAVEGGAVSVSASSDTVTVTAREIGESKVTVTATAAMAASSFIPEQTVSDVASITFPVMVVDGMTEPVPALPLFGQLLLALFMMAGGTRLYRRRQG